MTISRSPVASPWRPISARRDSSSPPIFKRRKRPTFSNCVPRPVTALEIETGCLHTEVKFTPEGPRVIEINGRVGGGVPEMLKRATGVSLLAATLRMALGQPASLHGTLPTDRIGYRFFLQPPAVTASVAAIDGIETFARRSGADSISIHQGPGADIDWRDGTRNYILSVLGSVESYEELQAVEKLLQDEISVTYSI